MILIKNLKLNNFLSHSETEISFNNNEKLLLDGKSGAGKTAICEGILFALFGRGRSDNRNLVRKGQKLAIVSLKLIDEKIETIITRSITDKGKNTLTITQKKEDKFLPIERTGLKDHEDWIQNVFLKTSYELFINSVVYTQDGQENFVKTTASRRKDLLLEIIHASNFDELYEETKRAISSIEVDLAVDSSKVSNTESLLKTAGEMAEKYESFKKMNENTSGQIDVYVSSEKRLDKQLNDASQISGQILDKKTMKQMTLNSISKIDYQLESDKKAIEEHNKLDIKKAMMDLQEADKLISELEIVDKELRDIFDAQQKINAHLVNKPNVTDYTDEIELINKRLIPLIKDSGKCPAGDACPFVIPIKGQIEFLTNQITEKTTRGEYEKKALDIWIREHTSLIPQKEMTEIYAKQIALKNQIRLLNESKEIVTKYELFERTSSEILIREMRLDKEKKEQNIALGLVNKEILELEKTLSTLDINMIPVELTQVREEIRKLREIKDEAAAGMIMATNAKKDAKEASEALVELKKGIIKATEDKECLELLKEALGSKGIRAVVIDYLIPTLEQRINDILSQLSDFRIRLDTQQSKADPEEGTREGLFIIVRNPEGEELPLSNLSGGEIIKVSMAIAEGLGSLGNSVGFKIIDEAIQSLDQESTESFVEVLLKLQEKFPQIIAVSHIPEVKECFEEKINIIKINGVSQIT